MKTFNLLLISLVTVIVTSIAGYTLFYSKDSTKKVVSNEYEKDFQSVLQKASERIQKNRRAALAKGDFVTYSARTFTSGLLPRLIRPWSKNVVALYPTDYFDTDCAFKVVFPDKSEAWNERSFYKPGHREQFSETTTTDLGTFNLEASGNQIVPLKVYSSQRCLNQVKRVTIEDREFLK